MPLGSLLLDKAGHLLQWYRRAVIEPLDLLAIMLLKEGDLL